jgi:predicted phage terminase large subunit-like protein
MATEPLIERILIQDELLKRRAEQSLRAYVEDAWPLVEPGTPFMPNWHIDLLCEYLEAVSAGQIRHLLINVPPRSMKSLLVSVLWPTWEWIRRPNGRWICASYAETLATKHSLDRRTVLQSDWYQRRWGQVVRLAPDQNQKGLFQNTQRGVMIATSVGGSITGKGGDRIIVDDPHNPQQVESDTQRESAITYFRRTLSTRLDSKNQGTIVVVMQRLHEHDLSAVCQELGYHHVCLPAEAEAHTTITFPRSERVKVRERGDLLWPAREGATALAMMQRVLGSANYAGQYQQRPAPAGGLLFKRDWFKFFDTAPADLSVTQSWDLAFKDGPENDCVVGLVGGKKDANIYLVDRMKGRWNFADTCRQIQACRQRHPKTAAILIEDTANGPAVMDTLKSKVPRIIPVQPEGGKQARAYAVQPLVEAGNIYLPNPRLYGQLVPERAWVEDFLHQLTIFPRGSHDDDVDAFTQLLLRLQRQPTVRVW